MSDNEDKTISETMLVLVAALELGAVVDLLAKQTGLPNEFISAIAQGMRKAGLWTGEYVDDREWWDREDGLFRHGMVAAGILLRQPNQNGGCEYFDAESGEFEMEWNPPRQQCKVEIKGKGSSRDHPNR